MFDAPLDAWYLWLGVTAASAAALGVAVSLPTVPPPDAERVAATVDAVAASGHEATGQQPLDAADVRLGPRRIGLRNAGGAEHATLDYGPVTPAWSDPRLRRVLRGEPPSGAFDDPAAFRAAAAAARNRSAEWRTTDGPLVIRRVSWGSVDVTLVGA